MTRQLIRILFILLIAICFCKNSNASTVGAVDDNVRPVVIPKFSFVGVRMEPGDSDSGAFSMPFSRAGNLIMVKGRVDSIEGNFILDTGCPGLVLNLTYFRHYNRTLETGADNESVTGSFGSVEQTVIQQFHFGPPVFYNLTANVVNLGQIENSKGIKIIGLLGMELLKRCEMMIDFENSRIHFNFPAKKNSESKITEWIGGKSSVQEVPIEFTDNRLIIRTVLEGKKMKFVIDCAAETNILDSRLPDKIFDKVSVTGSVLLTGVGNKKVQAVTGQLAAFKIGDREFTNLQVLVTNLEKTCFSHGGCVDGVLGFDFLSKQKIAFNFVKRKLYLWQ